MRWILERDARPGTDRIHTYDEVVELQQVGSAQRTVATQERTRDILVRFHGFRVTAEEHEPIPAESLAARLLDLGFQDGGTVQEAARSMAEEPEIPLSDLVSPPIPVFVPVSSSVSVPAADIPSPVVDLDHWEATDAWKAAGHDGEVNQADPEAMAAWVTWDAAGQLPPAPKRPLAAVYNRPVPSLPKRLPLPRDLAIVVCVHGWGDHERQTAARAEAMVQRWGHGCRAIVVQNRRSEAGQAMPGSVRCVVVPNRGYAHACNAGLQEATNEGMKWVLFTQGDCSWSEKAVRQALAYAQRTDGQAVVGPSGGYLNPIREWGRNIGGIGQAPQGVDFVAGYWILASVEAARVGWDDGLFLYWEDVDFCQRMAHAGHPLIVAPDLEVDHLRGQTIRRRLFPPAVYERIRSASRARFLATWDETSRAV